MNKTVFLSWKYADLIFKKQGSSPIKTAENISSE